MKTLLLAVLLTFSFSSFAKNSQHDKMKTCNVDAKSKDLKGAERKAFMKDCLSAAHKADKEARNAQHEKMKTCNADAKTKALKGAERKAFMKDCLSATHAAAPVAPAAPAEGTAPTGP